MEQQEAIQRVLEHLDRMHVQPSEDEKQENLRDYFAHAALMGEMACQDETSIGYISSEESADLVANKCYLMANAMIKARQHK